MKHKLHIIVTSEQGQAKTFVMSKPLLKRILTIASFVFVISTIAGVTYSIENFRLKDRIVNLESNVSDLSSTKQGLQQHVASLEEKAKAKLTGAYGELNKRSQIIDSILSALDIASPSPKNVALRAPSFNKGGPFTKISTKSLDDLILKVDNDLKTIKPIPLGYPVSARRVSSGFGRRIDPLNSQNAFHDGLDLSGSYGSEVKATADGKVIERGHNDTYGWYIKIDHGNNFVTLYAHNQKILAKSGAEVKRNEVIALLGSSGRSTGPHLHYEVRYKNRPINPAKFVNIDKLVSLSDG